MEETRFDSYGIYIANVEAENGSEKHSYRRSITRRAAKILTDGTDSKRKMAVYPCGLKER